MSNHDFYELLIMVCFLFMPLVSSDLIMVSFKTSPTALVIHEIQQCKVSMYVANSDLLINEKHSFSNIGNIVLGIFFNCPNLIVLRFLV